MPVRGFTLFSGFPASRLTPWSTHITQRRFRRNKSPARALSDAKGAVAPKEKRVMKDSLLTVLEAVRAAQATLKNGRNSSVTVEQLRDILCGARVLGAVRALSHDEEGFPRVPQNQPLPRHVAASSG